MVKENKDKERKKMPTAAKRDLQNVKKRMRNRSFKARVRTALRNFEESMSLKDSDKAKDAMNKVNSLMDKGVKKGIYKINKASRVKSKIAINSSVL
jgi:small subunit ribosomal protein S20